MKSEIIEAVNEHKIIAIVRGVESEKCMKVAKALYDGGIRLLEITYNQSSPDSWKTTANAISEIAKEFKGKMFIGAGTVTKSELVELTYKANGQYVISPNTNLDVIRKTIDCGLVSIPGAMTPTEIISAHDAGADFVKLFPASELGTGYLKAIRAPISNVALIATGGVGKNNAKAFLDAGSTALGIGGSLANKEAIASDDYIQLTIAAEEIIASIKN